MKALTLKSSINLDSREIPVEQIDSTYNFNGTESNDHSVKTKSDFLFRLLKGTPLTINFKKRILRVGGQDQTSTHAEALRLSLI